MKIGTFAEISETIKVTLLHFLQVYGWFRCIDLRYSMPTVIYTFQFFWAHMVQEIALFSCFQYGVGGHLGFKGQDRSEEIMNIIVLDLRVYN